MKKGGYITYDISKLKTGNSAGSGVDLYLPDDLYNIIKSMPNVPIVLTGFSHTTSGFTTSAGALIGGVYSILGNVYFYAPGVVGQLGIVVDTQKVSHNVLTLTVGG